MQAGDVVYVTKYALTAGAQIQELRVSKVHEDGRYVWVRTGGSQFSDMIMIRDRDVFSDKSKAIADAESRRTKKIRSLEKQIANLKKLKFG